MNETKSDKEEEEISIDFSKIKNLFKKKSGAIPPERQTQKEEAKPIDKEESTKKDEEEISIDFSRIKKFFKKAQGTKEDEPEEKGQDEIGIDFSKIKELLKQKSPEQSREEGIEFSELKKALNIKRLFKFAETKKEAVTESKSHVASDDIQFDIKNIFSSIYKKKAMIVPAILLLIVMIIIVHVRMQNADVPMTDRWARDSVNNFYLNQIRTAIEQKYPNLPDANKEALINTEYQKLLQEKGSEISEQIRQTSLFFKSKFQDDKGNLYMPDIDPYYWFRYARNIVEHGYIGDEVRGNKQFDNHMVAPLGVEIPHTDKFHPYFLAYFYKIVRLFNSSISLMNTILYYPLIISALAIIPIFFIAKRIGGNFAGVGAGLMIGINTMFVSKTLFGHADTDAWTVFFPTFILWFFFLAIESKAIVTHKNNPKLFLWLPISLRQESSLNTFLAQDIIMTIILSSLAGLLLGLYNYIWSGWWFIYDFILFSTIAYVFFSLIIYLKKNKSTRGYIKGASIKSLALSFILLTIFTGIIVTQAEGLKSFIQAPFQPLFFTQFKSAVYESNWPNVLTTVAELKEGNMPEIISNLGGKLYFLIAVIGIILIFLTDFNKKSLLYLISAILWFAILLNDTILQISLVTYLVLLFIPLIVGLLFFSMPKQILETKLAIILMIWLIAGIYASTKGIRFSLIIAAPFGIGFGVAISRLITYFTQMLNKELHVSKVISTILMVIVVSLLYIMPIQASYNTASIDLPIINDAWHNALTLIKTNSTKDAIITSWWDFGHHFKALADRRVTFDGGSQAYPQAHWVGNILLNSNEDTAIGILRMLNCGATNAFNDLDKIEKDTTKSVAILYQILDKDANLSRKILMNLGLKENEIEDIIKNTHCNTVENFFITSEDMVSKSGVWGHFGSWDFNRALAYNTLKKPEYDSDKGIKFLQDRFNYTIEEAENLYFEILNLKPEEVNNWISPWPIYSNPLPCKKLDNATLNCNNFLINLTSYEASIQSPTGIMRPKVVVFPVKNGYIKKEYNDSIALLQNGRPVGLTLIPGEDYLILPADYLLSDSIFTKLFYLDGHGLKNFRKFYEEQTVLGNKIIVWQVDWKGNVTNTRFPQDKQNGTYQQIVGNNTSI